MHAAATRRTVKTALGLLAMAHGTAGLVSASSVDFNRVLWQNFLFASIVGAQLCLVGLLAGLAARRGMKATVATGAMLLLGTLSLWVLSVTACGFWDDPQPKVLL